jgi:hypothetical protein
VFSLSQKFTPDFAHGDKNGLGGRVLFFPCDGGLHENRVVGSAQSFVAGHDDEHFLFDRTIFKQRMLPPLKFPKHCRPTKNRNG